MKQTVKNQNKNIYCRKIDKALYWLYLLNLIKGDPGYEKAYLFDVSGNSLYIIFSNV